MRIVIGTSGLSTGGGIGTYVEELSKWLFNKGHTVLVCVASEQKDIIEKFPFQVFLTTYSRNFSKQDEFKIIGLLFNKINSFSPDVIINNDNIYISGLFPSFKPDIVRLSVVHGFRNHFFGWDHHRIINNAAVYNHKYIDWIIAISDAMATNMKKKLKLPDNQIRFLYNGLHSNEDSFVPFWERKRKKTINFFFAGGGKREKGAGTLLKAVKKINGMKNKSIKIYWAGTLPLKGKFSKNYLGKFDFVEPLGRLGHSELLNVLSQCHYLLMPSRVEGCPMMMLEAMSLGVVPIVSDCPSAMREIVTDAGIGSIVHTGSTKELFNTINNTQKLKDNWHLDAEKIKDYFLKNLHIDKYGEKILKLCTVKRSSRIMEQNEFPPKRLLHYHRERFSGSKWSSHNLKIRWKNVTGKLEEL